MDSQSSGYRQRSSSPTNTSRTIRDDIEPDVFILYVPRGDQFYIAQPTRTFKPSFMIANGFRWVDDQDD